MYVTKKCHVRQQVMIDQLLRFVRGGLRSPSHLFAQPIYLYLRLCTPFYTFPILPCAIQRYLLESFEFVTNFIAISQKCHIIYLSLNANVDLKVETHSALRVGCILCKFLKVGVFNVCQRIFLQHQQDHSIQCLNSTRLGSAWISFHFRYVHFVYMLCSCSRIVKECYNIFGSNIEINGMGVLWGNRRK